MYGYKDAKALLLAMIDKFDVDECEHFIDAMACGSTETILDFTEAVATEIEDARLDHRQVLRMRDPVAFRRMQLIEDGVLEGESYADDWEIEQRERCKDYQRSMGCASDYTR